MGYRHCSGSAGGVGAGREGSILTLRNIGVRRRCFGKRRTCFFHSSGKLEVVLGVPGDPESATGGPPHTVLVKVGAGDRGTHPEFRPTAILRHALKTMAWYICLGVGVQGLPTPAELSSIF